jgi:RNA polymerase sigma-70 factor (ECF subfamily)
LSTWLYRLVVNLYADERRRQRRWLPLSSLPLRHSTSAHPAPEAQLAESEIALAVRKAIENLRPAHRAAVALKYLDDLSYQEIAQILGCSIGTVASRLNRAHRLLAKKLAYLRGSLQGQG